jgi:hypothetical protein
MANKVNVTVSSALGSMFIKAVSAKVIVENPAC